MALLIVKLDDPCPKLTQIRQLTPNNELMSESA